MAKKTSTKKVVAKKAPAKKKAPVKKASTPKKPATKKAPVKKAAAQKKAAPKRQPHKQTSSLALMSALATHSTFVAKVQALAGRKVLRLKTSHHTSGDLLPKKCQVRLPSSSLLTIYFGPKVKTLRSQRVASPLVHRHLFGNQTQPTIDSKSPRHHEGFFFGSSSFTGKILF